MITQVGQFLFYRGGIYTISMVLPKVVEAQKMSGKTVRINVKDISLHPTGFAWKVSKRIK